MPPVGFEPTISAGERPQNNALDRAATGTGEHRITLNNKYGKINSSKFPAPGDGKVSETRLMSSRESM